MFLQETRNQQRQLRILRDTHWVANLCTCIILGQLFALGFALCMVWKIFTGALDMYPIYRSIFRFPEAPVRFCSLLDMLISVDMYMPVALADMYPLRSFSCFTDMYFRNEYRHGFGHVILFADRFHFKTLKSFRHATKTTTTWTRIPHVRLGVLKVK